jgi:hypothetical protein
VVSPEGGDGRPLDPEELPKFMENYEWELPFCFCSLRDGRDVLTALCKPMTPTASSFQKWCIVCRYGTCSYYGMPMLTSNLVITNYANLEVVVSELLKRSPNIKTETCNPKQELGRQRRGKFCFASIYMIDGLLMLGIQANGSGVGESSTKEKGKGRPVKGANTSFVSQQPILNCAVVAPGSHANPEDASSRGDELMLGCCSWTNFVLAVHSPAEELGLLSIPSNMSLEESLGTVLRLVNPEITGAPHSELVRALYHCPLCDNVLVHHYRQAHTEKCHPQIYNQTGREPKSRPRRGLSYGMD